MKLLSKLYRFINRMFAGFGSTMRIIHFKISYPSLRIDFNTHVSSGVEIFCADDSICEISGAYLSRGAYIKVDTGGSLKLIESSVGPYARIVAHHYIEINAHCSIAEMVVIRDQNHEIISGTLLKNAGYSTASVILHRNVWLGSKSTILKGVELGANTVVGAHSLVNKSFPANSVIAGIPARSIKG